MRLLQTAIESALGFRSLTMYKLLYLVRVPVTYELVIRNSDNNSGMIGIYSYLE